MTNSTYTQILHAESAMSREKFVFSKLILGTKIRHLRKDIAGLKEQQDLADFIEEKLGKRVTGNQVSNWENGRSYPDAAELLAILTLCPDKESLEKFGIDVGRYVGVDFTPVITSAPHNALAKIESPTDSVPVMSTKTGDRRALKEVFHESHAPRITGSPQRKPSS